MEATQTAGQLICQFREAEGLSQSELADFIHVSQEKLAHWEEGSTLPGHTMVARLTGALRLSSEQAEQLRNAVDAAWAEKKKEKAATKAILAEQKEDAERLQHKATALSLLGAGLLGFVGGCAFSFITGTNKSVWYFPFIIGALFAGVPYGWHLVSKGKDPYELKTYYTDPVVDIVVSAIATIIKFIFAYFIGTFAFPVVLTYHAYKAGRKGSLYRKIMCLALITIVLFVCLLLTRILL